jgi:hypothetical protein
MARRYRSPQSSKESTNKNFINSYVKNTIPLRTCGRLFAGNSREVLFGYGSFSGINCKSLCKVSVAGRHGVRECQQVHLVQTGEAWQVCVRQQAREEATLSWSKMRQALLVSAERVSAIRSMRRIRLILQDVIQRLIIYT